MKTTTAKKIMRAMAAELERSAERLKVPGHPKPYFVSYLVRDVVHHTIWGRYGALCLNKADHRRMCYADVRVGSYRYDQVAKGGLLDNSDESESYELTDMPLDDDVDALRFALWRLSDARYRESVRHYHARKSRDISFLDENKALPSFAKVQGEASDARIKLDELRLEREEWERYVREASRTFKEFPDIKNSYVEFQASLQTKLFMSSEGTARVWQEPLFSVTAYMWLHTKRGDLDFSIVHHVRRAEELPDLARLRRAVREKVELLRSMEAAKELTSYAGPVLLSPRAAGLLIHEVLGHRLEGSRLLSDDEGRTFKDKLGDRITHPDLTIYDDPKLSSWNGTSLIGAYPFDDEGSPAEKALLVERGVLRGFLTTRSPIRKGAHHSNGHARNQSFERPISRMANLIVESSSKHSWNDLKTLLIAEVKARRLPFGLMLLDVEGGETGTEAYNFQAFLGEITVAVKVFPSGKEELVRGVDFVGTPLASLSQILAVGRDAEVDNGFCGAESGSIPVSTVAPPLLLGTLELQAKSPAKVTQYVLPLPWHDLAGSRP